MKTILLINANAHVIWTEASTIEAAQRAADAIAGYRQEWTAITRQDFESGMGDRFIAVAMPESELTADDADHAISLGQVLGYGRVEDVLDHAA